MWNQLWDHCRVPNSEISIKSLLYFHHQIFWPSWKSDWTFHSTTVQAANFHHVGCNHLEQGGVISGPTIRETHGKIVEVVLNQLGDSLEPCGMQSHRFQANFLKTLLNGTDL